MEATTDFGVSADKKDSVPHQIKTGISELLAARSISNRNQVKIKVLVSHPSRSNDSFQFKEPARRFPKQHGRKRYTCKPLGLKLQQSLARLENVAQKEPTIKERETEFIRAVEGKIR